MELKLNRYWLYMVYKDWGDISTEYNMLEFIKVFGEVNKYRLASYGLSFNGWLYE
jgi:hypothetical protein